MKKKRNTEYQVVVEEVARIALEDMRYRNYVAHELDLSDEEMEKAYQYLCQLVRDEGGEPE
jgi:hypothetical protein